MIRVSAFRWVPAFARGLVRDLRVRWALEEAGLPYEERLIGPEDQEGGFSAADLLMTTVPRILRHTDLLQEQPALLAYKERCEARPAFARALAGQMAAFASSNPEG